MAIVALARKILCILYHLLMNQEMYEEPGAARKTRPNRLDQSTTQREFHVSSVSRSFIAESL